MTEKSWPWDTNPPTGGAGDGSAGLNEAGAREMLSLYFRVQDPTEEGVSKGVLNELEVSGAASPLSIASGSGVCYGLYTNDAVVNIPVATPAVGTTGGRVVLQTNWAGVGGAPLEARTRIAVKNSSDGDPSIPALTHSVGVTWEVSLATFQITTGGVITVTDDRTFRKSTGVVGTEEILANSIVEALIANNAVTEAKIANDAVTSSKIATGAVGSDEIATNAVVNSKMADDSVGEDELIAKSVIGTEAIGVGAFFMNQRQGDSGGGFPNDNWGGKTAEGTDNIDVEDRVLVQVGNFRIGTSGIQTVTFPEAFDHAPIVFAQVYDDDADPYFTQINGGNTTSVQIKVYDTSGVLETGQPFVYWMAIGAKA